MIPILDNFDINEISDTYNLNIICLTDEDIKTIKHQANKHYIINLNDGSDVGHWTALYIKHNAAYYFDSFGVPPTENIIKFTKRNNLKCRYNNNDVQFIKDVSCGFYCIAFIHFMIHVNDKSNGIYNFTRKFNNDTKKNISVLRAYLKDNLI